MALALHHTLSSCCRADRSIAGWFGGRADKWGPAAAPANHCRHPAPKDDLGLGLVVGESMAVRSHDRTFSRWMGGNRGIGGQAPGVEVSPKAALRLMKRPFQHTLICIFSMELAKGQFEVAERVVPATPLLRKIEKSGRTGSVSSAIYCSPECPSVHLGHGTSFYHDGGSSQTRGPRPGCTMTLMPSPVHHHRILGARTLQLHPGGSCGSAPGAQPIGPILAILRSTREHQTWHTTTHGTGKGGRGPVAQGTGPGGVIGL